MNEAIDWDVDDFAPASHAVFTRQETNYLQGEGFQLFSMLTLAFLQMGIIEFEWEKSHLNGEYGRFAIHIMQKQ